MTTTHSQATEEEKSGVGCRGRITHLSAEVVDAPLTYEYLQVEAKHSLQ